MKEAKSFRLEVWLSEDLKNYATIHNLAVPATGDFNFAKVIHGYIMDLKQKANSIPKIEKDLAIFRAYADKLQKEQKPFPCQARGENVTSLECYMCLTRTRENPSGCPVEVRECPKVKGIV